MKKILKQTSGNIERLLQHSQYLNYLSKRLLTYLPAEFQQKVSVIGFSTKKNKQNLTVATTSPAWASKLRFYIPILKRSLSSEAQFSQLKKIVIRVIPPKISAREEENNPVYSKNSATIIKNSAGHIENKELQASLMRLARSVEKNSR